ncbi:MAG: EAL domain-containing protein [Burkholderiaceae bacterium]|nr:EAL domain-containing protein [Burkholderiaceae bacterium]
MSTATTNDHPSTSASRWLRLHRWLLPDYNRKAALYWWSVVLMGFTALAASIHVVAGKPVEHIWQILIGAAIATVAGMFPVRVPRSTSAFVAGDVYIFLLLAMHGPAAAVLAAAMEATVGVCRSSKRWSSRLASPAMASLAMFTCGSLFQFAADGLKSAGLFGPGALVTVLMATGALYSFANSTLVSTVFKLKAGASISLRSWFADWGWVGLTYVATAALAALLYLTFEQFGITVLVVSAPMLALFLAALHYFFAQQSAAEGERQARTEAAEREAAQSAAHLAALERSEKRFHSAFTHASSGMALVSMEGRVLQANLAFGTLLGHDAATLGGREFSEFLFGDDASLLHEQLGRVLSGEVDAFSTELRFRHRIGREIWGSLHCGFFADSASTDRCLIVQVHDITARRRAEGRLQHIAYHDSLTNLANRNRFHDCLDQALQAQRHDPSRHFAVMYLDFDRFKLINDSLGHGAGDEFLVKVARRIQEHVRPNDVVARLGGDEFAILTEHLGNTHHAVALAERLQAALRRPLQIAGKEISTSASIGITFSDVGYRTPEEVLRDADLAMYKAKARGKAQYALFDTSLHQQATEQLSLEADLRRAIENNELAVVFQPIYEIASRTLVSFEALLRWTHPERGPISPATFIPLAEESGLIEAISHWVTVQSCAQLAAWHAQFPQHAHIGMHVNASSRDLGSTSYVRLVAELLERHDLRASRLTLEITENVLMQRVDAAADTLAQLQELGVGLSVDDFGTGYSSLSYLSTLPISSLKIDRSFVRQLQGSAENLEIVRAVINLATSLGKQVIAEGIESDAQLQRLVQLGCGHGQGFHLAEPLSVRQATALLSSLEPPVEPAAVVDRSEPRLVAAGGGAPRLQLVH